MSFLARSCRRGSFLLSLIFVFLLTVSPDPASPQGALQRLVAPPASAETTAETAAETATDANAEAAPTGLTAEQTQLLVNLLRDQAAREALIVELERLATERASAAPASTGAETVPAGEAAPDANASHANAPASAAEAAPQKEHLSFGRRIAQDTQQIAEATIAHFVALVGRLAALPDRLSGLSRLDTGALLDIFFGLSLVIVTTFGLLAILHGQTMRLYRWMGEKARPMGYLGATFVYVSSVVVDAMVVLVAWAVGYVVALTAFGEFGSIAIRQTLYLNAFLMIEMVKVGFRAVLSPASQALRPVRIPDHAARLTYRTLGVVAGIVGYSELLIVPTVARNIDFYAARSISTLLLVVALAILTVAVLRHRRPVADWLCDGGARRAAPHGRLWRTLSRLWHVPALLYLAAIFLIVVTRPGDVLLPVLVASARIAVVAAIGWVVAGLIGQAIQRGITLPAGICRRLPLLERRLNTFVPRILLIMRALILIAVFAFVLQQTGLADIDDWLYGPVGVWLTTTVGAVSAILLFCFLVWLALSSWVEYRLNPDIGRAPTAREQTLLTLLRNAMTILLIAITLMFVLSEIGIDIAPLIASAGILGLAIGFGAQKMVQDIITGVFIQLENAINVGDYVTAGPSSGTVERLTIRSVSLRDLHGVYHIVPFSSVDVVSNYMREFGFAVADIRIAYRMDVDIAQQAMRDAFEELRANPAYGVNIIGDFEWFGVNGLTESAVILRGRIKALAGYQWGIGRAYNEIIKRIFDERGIEIPYPHQTIYLGQGRQGEVPTTIRTLSDQSGPEMQGPPAPTTGAPKETTHEYGAPPGGGGGQGN